MSERSEARMTVERNFEQNMGTEKPVTRPVSMVDEAWGESFGEAEEFEWLMSLALDDALEADEAARFDWLLQQDAEHAARWEQWQDFDHDFAEMPSVVPAVDFAEKFALRLEIQERRRRLRTGVIFGLAAVALWGSALAGVVMLGALAWSNQGMWLATVIENAAAWWAARGQLAQAMLGTAEALWEAPQTRTLLVCYVLSAMAILGGWFTFLRRSTRELPIGESQLVEA